MKVSRSVWFAAGGLAVVASVALVLLLLPASESKVVGTVRLDDVPLQKGSIAWIPIEGTPGPGGGAGIDKDGKYEIKQGLRPGKYRVEIRSTITINRPVRDTIFPSDLVDEEVSVIPDHYNSKSGLVREVGRGSNVINFELERAAASK
jgi:hypothetical protein